MFFRSTFAFLLACSRPFGHVVHCFSVALFVYAVYPLQDEIDELVVTYQVLSTVASERSGTMNFVCVVVAALEPRIALYVCFLIFCVLVVVRVFFLLFALCCFGVGGIFLRVFFVLLACGCAVQDCDW